MDIWTQLGQVVASLIQVPAVQGIAVAAVTEAVKRAPVGPSGGNGIRLLAALLSIAAAFATAAAEGDINNVDTHVVASHLTEALSAFLAAVGAWQLAAPKKAPPAPPVIEEPVINPS